MYKFMAYSGIYTLKNKQKYKGNPNGIVYRSLWEKQCFMWCDTNSSVKSWVSEEVVIPYFYDVDKHYHRYFVDLLIQFEDKTVLVEIKPKKETMPPEFKGRRTKRYLEESFTFVKNQNKWAAAKEYAEDRGWKFEVWTEDTLRAIGIMKQQKLPALKPLKNNINKRKKS